MDKTTTRTSLITSRMLTLAQTKRLPRASWLPAAARGETHRATAATVAGASATERGGGESEVGHHGQMTVARLLCEGDVTPAELPSRHRFEWYNCFVLPGFFCMIQQ